jgi:hypothetical protein
MGRRRLFRFIFTKIGANEGPVKPWCLQRGHPKSSADSVLEMSHTGVLFVTFSSDIVVGFGGGSVNERPRRRTRPMLLHFLGVSQVGKTEIAFWDMRVKKLDEKSRQD